MKSFQEYGEQINQVVAKGTTNTPIQNQQKEPDRSNAFGGNYDEFKTAVSKLSTRLGQKANKYMPLLRYISKNPSMLTMFEELISDTSTLQASMGRKMFGNQGE